MKNFFFTLFLSIVFFASAQKTYVPDDNFEQALIDLGYDSGVLDDSVLTANIETVLSLNVSSGNIEDLTGIEDFTNLGYLDCSNNMLITINVSSNLQLQSIICAYNQLENLDVSNNTALSIFYCPGNQLSVLDVSNNPNLMQLGCDENQLTFLDLSNNPELELLRCTDNQLTALNLANGYNSSTPTYINASGNENLNCIQVDNANYSYTNWGQGVDQHFIFDVQSDFNENCNAFVSVTELESELPEIYPNPVTDILYVKLENKAYYNLYSLLGKESQVSGSLTQGEHQIDVSKLDNGIYLLKVETEGGGSSTTKIVKQ